MFGFSPERHTAKEHLIEGDAHRPDVSLLVVDVSSEALLGHVDGSAHVVVIPLHQAPPLAKSKISYFQRPLGSHEDVSWLEVTVDEASSVEMLVALEYLQEQPSCLFLRETALLLY